MRSVRSLLGQTRPTRVHVTRPQMLPAGAEPRRPLGGPRPAVSSSQEFSSAFGGEDFYAIFGVPPSASPREIRTAYRSLMRRFHPDLAPDEGLRNQLQQLCSLLNQIAETLSDEDSRAVYDRLAGFSHSAPNPFLDTSFARDQLFVDEVSCIGCGKCVRACPRTFEIEASKYGRARVISQQADSVDEVQVAIECCPVDCIHWVSLPQLSLLEAALARMGRVEVSVMQRFGRSGGNVFEVAYKAWEKRMSEIEERAAAAAGRGGRARVDWSFWTGGGSLPYDEEAEQRAAAMDPEQRRVARLAASAARASRLWQFLCRLCNAAGAPAALAESSSASVDSV